MLTLQLQQPCNLAQQLPSPKQLQGQAAAPDFCSPQHVLGPPTAVLPQHQHGSSQEMWGLLGLLFLDALCSLAMPLSEDSIGHATGHLDASYSHLVLVDHSSSPGQRGAIYVYTVSHLTLTF